MYGCASFEGNKQAFAGVRRSHVTDEWDDSAARRLRADPQDSSFSVRQVAAPPAFHRFATRATGPISGSPMVGRYRPAGLRASRPNFFRTALNRTLARSHRRPACPNWKPADLLRAQLHRVRFPARRFPSTERAYSCALQYWWRDCRAGVSHFPPRVLVQCQAGSGLPAAFHLTLVSAAACGQGSGARSELAGSS